MLKTSIQSQLDGVRTGLNQLQNALKDIQGIKDKCLTSDDWGMCDKRLKVLTFFSYSSLTEIEMAYRGVAGLDDKLADIQEENSRHSQVPNIFC